MKLERTKNAGRNILFGVVVKVYQILIPFILRTIFIYTLGIEYLGLNSLFTSVLSVLNLFELGVGAAMVFSMYKPIVKDDKEKICALMNLYKSYYRIIGAVILLLGLCIIPLIPKLISGKVPSDINIYIIYILNLLTTVISYWLFAYKNCILSAHQRVDMASKVTLGVSTIQYLLQAVFLIAFKSYYLYLIIALIAQIVTNIAIKIVADKLYPSYIAKGQISSEERKIINGKVRDLFTSHLGGTVVNTADSLVISAFLGITVLAIYQNYYYIVSSVIGFLAIIYSSVTAGVGNSILLKSKEDNYKDLNIFTLLITWLAGVCICCFVVLFQPFMVLWLGKSNVIDYGIVVLLAIYFWVYEWVMMLSVYKDAAGIWHKDRFRPLVSGVVNLFLNLLMVKYIQLYGVVLSSVISILFISLPWIIINVHSLIFQIKPLIYFFRFIMYSLIIGLVTFVAKILDGFIVGDGVVAFILRFVLAIAISNISFLLLFRLSKYYNGALDMVGRMLHIERIMEKIKRKKYESS